jgi:hypothetical protein
MEHVIIVAGQDSEYDMSKTCAWCGGPLEAQTWKNGKKVYCSSSCHSAGVFHGMVVATVTMAALVIATILFPQSVAEVILGPLSGVLLLAFTLYAAIGVFFLACLYIAYDGWRVRSGRHSKQPKTDGVIQYD